MKNILQPKWLLIINTLPICVLFVLLYSQYHIIEPLLKNETKALWYWLGGSLLVISGIHLVFTLWASLKKIALNWMYASCSLIIYLTFVYLYGYHIGDLISRNIPNWMLNDSLFLYVGTFLMPTLAHSLYLLVITMTNIKSNPNAWFNLLGAIAVPISIYLFSQVISPLWRPYRSELGKHTLVILLILATLLFLFFVIRFVYILFQKKYSNKSYHKLLINLPFSILLPILGLCLHLKTPIFGDLSSPYFFLLSSFSGVILCINDDSISVKNRYLMFVLKSITFSYSLYLFLVFLPFAPVAVLLIAIVGLGILILTPLIVFSSHVYQLKNDYVFLRKHYPKLRLNSTFFLSFLVIPIIVTFSFIQDKHTLNKALNYVYHTDYSKEININSSSLENTLENIALNKRNSSFFISDKTPYLASYYNWLVLDNLTLSYDKINKLKQVFLGETKNRPSFRNSDAPSKVELSHIETESTYDSEQKVWKSWVHTELINTSENLRFQEYVTKFKLPQGAMISDYYLYVGDRKEFGILAEKKSAQWIFNQIRNRNRDPGILYYGNGNNIHFKVFPFDKKEIRKTGFEIIHKEPIDFEFDTKRIHLGHATDVQQELVNTETEHFKYISASEKKKLPKVNPDFNFHFFIDTSVGKDSLIDANIQKIDTFLKQHPTKAKNAVVSLVNSNSKTIPANSDWKHQYKGHDFKGGFFLDYSFKKQLIHNYHQNKKELFIVVSEHFEHAILQPNYVDYEFTYVGTPYFFTLNNSTLEKHSFSNTKNSVQNSSTSQFTEDVYVYKSNNKIHYLTDNGKADWILKTSVDAISSHHISTKNWLTGMYQKAQYRSQLLNPKLSDTYWFNAVQSSFESRILSPVTSYIVVENEAQKRMLLKKQKEVLKGKKSLDTDEVNRMSEPSTWILLIIFLGFIIIRKRQLKFY